MLSCTKNTKFIEQEKELHGTLFASITIIEPGEPVEVEYLGLGLDLAEGEYECITVICCDDTENPEIEVPVTLVVGNAAPEPFGLISPANGEVLDLIAPHVIIFEWQASINPDPENEITYNLFCEVTYEPEGDEVYEFTFPDLSASVVSAPTSRAFKARRASPSEIRAKYPKA